MITKDSIETAYSFLHQKQRIYVHSTLDWQKDDIELAISDYANQEDITKAVEILEKMLYNDMNVQIERIIKFVK